jgi:hypothetical protein
VLGQCLRGNRPKSATYLSFFLVRVEMLQVDPISEKRESELGIPKIITYHFFFYHSTGANVLPNFPKFPKKNSFRLPD